MSSNLATMNTVTDLSKEDAALAAEAATVGDLSALSPEKRTHLYGAICRSVGLNPLTKPFEYIKLNGKLTLYALKGATDQLRKVNGISITQVDAKQMGDVLIVTVYAQDKTGRTDSDIGAVPIGPQVKGEALANAHMKAITKAKRRVTLSLAGLGWLDESEVDSIPRERAQPVRVSMETGEIQDETPRQTREVSPQRTEAPQQVSAAAQEDDEALIDAWTALDEALQTAMPDRDDEERAEIATAAFAKAGIRDIKAVPLKRVEKLTEKLETEQEATVEWLTTTYKDWKELNDVSF